MTLNWSMKNFSKALTRAIDSYVTGKGRTCIFHMCIPCDKSHKTFTMYNIFWPSDLDFEVWLLNFLKYINLGNSWLEMVWLLSFTCTFHVARPWITCCIFSLTLTLKFDHFYNWCNCDAVHVDILIPVLTSHLQLLQMAYSSLSSFTFQSARTSGFSVFPCFPYILHGIFMERIWGKISHNKHYKENIRSVYGEYTEFVSFWWGKYMELKN